LQNAVIAQIGWKHGMLPSSVEITDQIDPRLMRLRLDQCLIRSVKDAPLSSHGDASMRLAQEKDAPLVN
jgi:hypothetical protein